MSWNPHAGGWMVARTETGVEIYDTPDPNNDPGPIVVIEGVCGADFYGCSSYAGRDLPEPRVGQDWFSGADPYYGSIFSDIGHFVSKAAQTVAQPIAQVGKTVENLASDAVKVAGVPLHVAQGALNLITHNPVWDVAQGAISFVPLIGQAVSSGMAIAAQIGKGGSALDFALAAAKGALPGQPVSGYAFDVAVGLLLKGQRLDAKALELARSQVPGGELGKRAFDLAVSIILGKHVSVKDVVVNTAKEALPKIPSLQAAFESGVGLAKSKFASPSLVANVTNLIPAAARSAFQAGLATAKANQLNPQNLAALAKKMPATPVGKAMQNVVAKAAGTQIAKAQRQVAAAALGHATRLVMAMNRGDARAKAAFSALAARAKAGDRAALAAISIAQIASREFRKRNKIPTLHAGEMMIAGFSPKAFTSSLFHSLPTSGLATWAEPHVKGTHGTFLFRY